MATVVRTINPVKDEDLWLASAKLADERRDAERNLVGSILADPAMVSVAREVGIEPGDFWSPDYRLIFCAALVAADLGRGTVLRLARKALRAEQLWDATSPAWYGGELHSDATLAALAGSYPPNPAAVRFNATTLINLSRRQCTAQHHLDRAAALLLKGAA